MDSQRNRNSSSVQRQLANLKLVSRLLGHELHSQGSAKTVTLTREEVVEIQTTIDLFIEEVARGNGPFGAGGAAGMGGIAAAPQGSDIHLVPARN
jgi:hypothetical protein